MGGWGEPGNTSLWIRRGGTTSVQPGAGEGCAPEIHLVISKNVAVGMSKNCPDPPNSTSIWQTEQGTGRNRNQREAY